MIYGNRDRVHERLLIGLLAAILGYAVYHSGGTERGQWNVCLLGLGLIALVYRLGTPRSASAPSLEPWLRWAVILLPCYAVLQLIPLPARLLGIVSPNRADQLAALLPVVPMPPFATLSVAPSATFAHFLRICGYTVMFLLIRELARRLRERPWALALPIIIIAGIEAAFGLLQFASGGSETPAQGTYINKNHYAGLLEMALPFAVAYAPAVLRRVRIPMGRAAKACGGILIATLIILGILYSLSRMGFLASLGSLCLMAVLALSGARLSRARRWVLGSLMASAIVLGFMLLAPPDLILRFEPLSHGSEVRQGRTHVWRDTLHLIAAYPLFGCGLGGYESAFLKFQSAPSPFIQDYAHNDYLQLLAELGVIGFSMAAAIMLLIYASAVRAARRHPEPDGRWLGLACTGAITALLIHSLADFNLYIPANALLLAWISGLAAGLAVSSRPGGAQQLHRGSAPRTKLTASIHTVPPI